MTFNCTILILAAGSSSRMGKIKQLLPWKKTTLLGNAILQANKSHARCTITVLGAHAEKIIPAIEDLETRIIVNSDWQQGMSSSISFGLRHILNTPPKNDAILIMLADQPFMDSDHLNEMIKLAQKHPDSLIATAYDEKNGVPALFPQHLLEKLLSLEGDKGAGHLLNNSDFHTLEVSSPGKTEDIDTYDVYLKYQNRIT